MRLSDYVVSARNPVRRSPDSIDLLVEFTGIGDEVPFTAALNDRTAYGQELYMNALKGKYGTVQDAT